MSCIAPNQSQARLVEVHTYKEMLAKSDLVVIANPKGKTTDTREHAFFPGISRQDKDGKQSKVEAMGVETIFVVSAVLKGATTIKKFTLHHYREADTSHVSVNGPMLVFLTRQRTSIRICFFLFANRMAALPQQVARLTQALKRLARFHSTDCALVATKFALVDRSVWRNIAISLIDSGFRRTDGASLCNPPGYNNQHWLDLPSGLEHNSGRSACPLRLTAERPVSVVRNTPWVISPERTFS